MGNRISSLFVHLPVAAADPRRALRLQVEEAETLKAGHPGEGSSQLLDLAQPHAAGAAQLRRALAVRDPALQRHDHQRPRAADAALLLRLAGRGDLAAGPDRRRARGRAWRCSATTGPSSSASTSTATPVRDLDVLGDGIAELARGAAASWPPAAKRPEMFQVRIHGRGGQGVVTAAELLSVAAFEEGRHAQAFPTFGSERTGRPGHLLLPHRRPADPRPRADLRARRADRPGPDAAAPGRPLRRPQRRRLRADQHLAQLRRARARRVRRALPPGRLLTVPATEIAPSTSAARCRTPPCSAASRRSPAWSRSTRSSGRSREKFSRRARRPQHARGRRRLRVRAARDPGS